MTSDVRVRRFGPAQFHGTSGTFLINASAIHVDALTKGIQQCALKVEFRPTKNAEISS